MHLPLPARWLLERACVPALSALHRLTGKLPFPVAEALGLALLLLFAASLCRAAAARSLRPVRHALRVLFILLLALVSLWGPALAVKPPALPDPGADALTRLCEKLIDGLNASPLAFPDAAEILARAPAVAGGPARAVKAARLPGWMALARAWGLFVPLTGEALVDPAEPAPLIPFTAVHELTHLSGVADEGTANVAAWERCRAAGGPFADSAALWALRYAMGCLRALDPAAWQAERNKMEDTLLRAFLDCGGEADPASPRTPLTRGDYAALVCYLAGFE